MIETEGDQLIEIEEKILKKEKEKDHKAEMIGGDLLIEK